MRALSALLPSITRKLVEPTVQTSYLCIFMEEIMHMWVPSLQQSCPVSLLLSGVHCPASCQRFHCNLHV